MSFINMSKAPFGRYSPYMLSSFVHEMDKGSFNQAAIQKIRKKNSRNKSQKQKKAAQDNSTVHLTTNVCQNLLNHIGGENGSGRISY